jgi:hypothetical protein
MEAMNVVFRLHQFGKLHKIQKKTNRSQNLKILQVLFCGNGQVVDLQKIKFENFGRGTQFIQIIASML